MQVFLIAVGRLKSTELARLCDDYGQRLLRYVRFSLIEVRDVRQADPRQILAREAEALLQRVPDGARRVALDVRGEAMSSEGLAQWLEQELGSGRSSLCFLIGGPHGLAPDLVARADRRLSLSTLTLPHEIARLVLLEQLYRAMTIVRGEPYHK